MIAHCSSCHNPTTSLIQGGSVVLTQCYNQACPQNLNSTPGRVNLFRCPDCGSALTRRNSWLSERKLECLPCGKDFDIPACFIPEQNDQAVAVGN